MSRPSSSASFLSRLRVPLLIGLLVCLLLGLLALLHTRARQQTNQVALSSQPKGVTVIAAAFAKYRSSRRYVGTVAPWLEARIGPQLTSAYVDTVLVRPGDRVQRSQVLATLDCRNASEQSRALAMQARALHATQEALAKETGRVSGLLEGGYVSPNEVDRRVADSASKQAELLAANARLARASLEVDDCVLRAPFDGEVADRFLDPGAFARPGSPVLSVVDREQVRIVLDVPETDCAVVEPGSEAKIRFLALGTTMVGKIARRAPAADSATRTIHAEIDLLDAQRKLPVGTTAELTLSVGEAVDASELPLRAASIRGDQATLFVLAGDIAHKRKVPVLGEALGSLFVPKQALAQGELVVTEGRALLSEGDRVQSKQEPRP
ncbi:MAG: efflux RND transporter periplasmic adaptor subunit [Polyangia bacterium]